MQQFFQILGHILSCLESEFGEHVPGHTEGRAGDDDVGDVLLCLAAAVGELANTFPVLRPMAT